MDYIAKGILFILVLSWFACATITTTSVVDNEANN